jgi:hypothetical protein
VDDSSSTSLKKETLAFVILIVPMLEERVTEEVGEGVNLLSE